MTSATMPEDLTRLLPNKPTFTIAETAAILGVSIHTVYRRIEDGTISPHLTIKPYRVRRDVLLKFLAE